MRSKNATFPSELDHSARQRLVCQWTQTGRVLAAAKRRSLANYSPQEQRDAAWDMSELGGMLPPDERREKWSGLIEMQRQFAKLRQRGNE